MLAAFVAYGIWGLLPIFVKLVDTVGSLEIVAQRIIWSLLLIVLILAARGATGALIAVVRDQRLMRPLALSATLIGVNWVTYVWAINSAHVLAASLGYFLNPLVNVLLGVLVLKERLRRGQIVAIAVAALGVALMAAAALSTLWISVALALTFGFYGLVRKLTPVAPMAGLGAETVVLAPMAFAYLGWLSATGGLAFGRDIPTSALLICLGAVTMAPLVLFATAARHLPMSTLGLLQYIAPTLQFLSGVLLFGETLSHGQIVSFGLIWAGLLLFALDSYMSARRNRLAVV